MPEKNRRTAGEGVDGARRVTGIGREEKSRTSGRAAIWQIRDANTRAYVRS